MQPGQPSRTALIAASHRAAHQVLESGAIFADPLALRILGQHADGAIADARNDPSLHRLRIFIAARTRIAEDALTHAIERGVTQLVMLGAGLDTFAYRSGFAQRLRMFEVDDATTLAWKRACLATAAIAAPVSLSYTPIDFEREALEQVLAAAGFDPALPSFFTLARRGAVSDRAGGIRDPELHRTAASLERDEYAVALARLAARVAALGETIKCQFETLTLCDRLIDLGFREVEDFGPKSIRERFLPQLGPVSSDRGGHVAHAGTL